MITNHKKMGFGDKLEKIDVASSWGSEGNRGTEYADLDKKAKKEKPDNPNFSINTPDDPEVPGNPDATDNNKPKEDKEKQQQQARFYNEIATRLGAQYSPEVLNKASAKYFDGAALENPADIQDPVKRQLAEEQNKQIEKVCKVLGEVPEGGGRSDVFKNAFIEYVQNVKLRRDIADMERTLSPYATSTSAENDQKGKASVNLNLLRDQAIRESGSPEEGERMYELPPGADGNVKAVSMTREGLTRYSGMLRAKVEEMNQANKDQAKLANLDQGLDNVTA